MSGSNLKELKSILLNGSQPVPMSEQLRDDTKVNLYLKQYFDAVTANNEKKQNEAIERINLRLKTLRDKFLTLFPYPVKPAQLCLMVAANFPGAYFVSTPSKKYDWKGVFNATIKAKDSVKPLGHLAVKIGGIRYLNGGCNSIPNDFASKSKSMIAYHVVWAIDT